ncbi:uncharacterized protein encoded by LINC02872 [Gorilla gorilla gorilla]|uniref:uncharacterized protein encoded by LINC02872 n=1 Tax=Gorilla gorilla gorilla TaxID=9595 RepID=UPI0001FA18C0
MWSRRGLGVSRAPLHLLLGVWGPSGRTGGQRKGASLARPGRGDLASCSVCGNGKRDVLFLRKTLTNTVEDIQIDNFRRKSDLGVGSPDWKNLLIDVTREDHENSQNNSKRRCKVNCERGQR